VWERRYSHWVLTCRYGTLHTEDHTNDILPGVIATPDGEGTFLKKTMATK
jgi:hypothetical protein